MFGMSGLRWAIQFVNFLAAVLRDVAIQIQSSLFRVDADLLGVRADLLIFRPCRMSPSGRIVIESAGESYCSGPVL